MTNGKIRILEVIGSLKVGGQERVATSIAEYIDKEKFQVDYLVYDDVESPNTKIVLDNGGNIIRVKDIYSNRLKIMERFEKVMRENGPYDVVHAHGMFNNGYVMRAAKKAGIKCRIAHAHSTNDLKEKKDFIYEIYKKIMLGYMLKYSTSFVACGKMAGCYLFGAERFLREGTIFYNRIDSRRYKYSDSKYKQLRNKLGVGNRKVFIIVGRLDRVKNHRFAFTVFNEYCKYDSTCLLFVLGDGEQCEYLKRCVIDLELDRRIIFLGNVCNVNEYMIAADCLLMPSFYEGLPVTLIEAQASGLHCIVSDTITKEVDIAGLISWRNINDISGWVDTMKLSYERVDIGKKIESNNYDYCNYTKWLTNFYNEEMGKTVNIF